MAQSYLSLNVQGATSPLPIPDSVPAVYRYEDLARYNGGQFVEELYYSLLQRAPDPEGFQSFFSQLEKGVAKDHLIRTMLNSAEAQQKGATVTGLPPLSWYKRLLEVIKPS